MLLSSLLPGQNVFYAMLFPTLVDILISFMHESIEKGFLCHTYIYKQKNPSLSQVKHVTITGGSTDAAIEQ